MKIIRSECSCLFQVWVACILELRQLDFIIIIIIIHQHLTCEMHRAPSLLSAHKTTNEMCEHTNYALTHSHIHTTASFNEMYASLRQCLQFDIYHYSPSMSTSVRIFCRDTLAVKSNFSKLNFTFLNLTYEFSENKINIERWMTKRKHINCGEFERPSCR